MNRAEHGREGVSILDTRGCDLAFDWQAERIHRDVSLAPIDFLAGVEAPRTARLGRLDRLAIDDDGGRRGFAALGLTPPRRLRVRYERAGRRPLLGRRSGRRQDDPRADRRGAADGARVEAEVTMQRWSVDPDQYAQAAMCKYGNVRVVTRTKSLHRRRTRSL